MSNPIIDDFLSQLKSKLKSYLSKDDQNLLLVGKFGTISFGFDISIDKRDDLLFLDSIRKKTMKIVFGKYEGRVEIDKHGSRMNTIILITIRFIEKVRADIKVTLSDGRTKNIGLYDEVYHVFQFRFDLQHGLLLFTYTIYNKILPEMTWHRAVDTAVKALKIYAFTIYELEYGLLSFIREHIDEFIDIVRGIIYS